MINKYLGLREFTFFFVYVLDKATMYLTALAASTLFSKYLEFVYYAFNNNLTFREAETPRINGTTNHNNALDDTGDPMAQNWINIRAAHWSTSFVPHYPSYNDYNDYYLITEKTRDLVFINSVANRYPSFIWAAVVSNSVENIVYANKNKFDIFISLLASDFETPLHSLIDICVVDNISRTDRFLLSYSFYNLHTLTFLTVRIGSSNYIPVYSISKIFNAAGWLEREIWDMYGITFVNHSDLRRILTDYGFTGHPLRKDFPLTGFFELRYNDIARRVDMEPLNLKQEMRFFFFNTNAWNYY
jgi:NADH:ubiquinone oxidoreductase 27 kD subunit